MHRPPDNQPDLRERIARAITETTHKPGQSANEARADAVIEELRDWWKDLGDRATSDSDLVFEVDQQIVYGKGGTL